MGHGLVQADVHQRLDVGDQRVDVLGQASGRNDTAGDHVHEDEFVARGVSVRQRHNANARGKLLLQRRDDVEILSLDSDDTLLRAHHLHGLDHAAQERLGQMVQQFLVFVQQRLALGGVGDDQGDARAQLYRGGKAAATGADDAEFADTGDGHRRRTASGQLNT